MLPKFALTNCCLAVVALGVALFQNANMALAQNARKISHHSMEGTSSTRAKSNAIASIPYSKINRSARSRIAKVVEHATIYRRLPVTTINNDPDLHLFAIRYPEVIVNIWQLMGITNMTLERADTYLLRSNDAAGTISNVELLYGTPNLHIFYCRGNYDGPMLMGKVSGDCVAILRTEYQLDRNGQPRTSNQLDVFLKIDQFAANIAARTVFPLIGSTADHNFVESMRFVEKLYETNRKNGRGVQQMIGRLNNVHPQVRARFAEIAEKAYIKDFERLSKANTQYPTQSRQSQTSRFYGSRPPVSQAPPRKSSRQQGYGSKSSKYRYDQAYQSR